MFSQRILTGDDFDFQTVIDSHGWVQLAPFAYDRAAQRLSRVHQLLDGRIIHLHIHADGNTNRDSFLRVEAEGDVFPADFPEITETVRRIMALDWDMTGFYTLLRDLPAYAWVEQNRVGRLLRAPTVWEDMVKTLLTTNTTWRQTREMVSRLLPLGDSSPYGDAFPRPEQIAALSLEDLNAQVRAGYRAAYLHAFAARIASGDLNVEGWIRRDIDSETLYKQIRSIKGFGDYAAGSIMRLLNHHDRLSIDSVARDAFMKVHHNGEKPTESHIRAHYDAYGQWRGLILWMDILRDDYRDGVPPES